MAKCSVLVVYNKPLLSPQAVMLESDAGILDEVKVVEESLGRLGYPHRTVGVNSLRELSANLNLSDEPVVINLIEFLPEDVQDASRVPAVCRAFGKGCTGNDTLALELGLDKWRSKGLLKHAGLQVPGGILVTPDQSVNLERILPGPYIVKPVATDASEGIDDKSLVKAADELLLTAVQRIHQQFKQAALIEQYVGERELNISLLQTGATVAVLPLAEVDFSALEGRPRIVSYAAKWLMDSFEYQHMPRLLPAPLAEETAELVRQTALAAWQAIGCQDYARVDMRLDSAGTPWVIEVNPNPDISLDAGFTAALLFSGASYDTFIDTIVQNAWDRYQRFTGTVLPATTSLPDTRIIRAATQADRSMVLSMLERSGFFRQDEIPVALEVFDGALLEESSYRSYVLGANSEVLGWISFGLTPGTLGTFDIYWLVVEPTHKTKGLGSTLLAFAEDQIKSEHGRLAVVETSGTNLYHPTRQFYQKRGYVETARLADYYAPGDDKLVYTKVIARDAGDR